MQLSLEVASTNRNPDFCSLLFQDLDTGFSFKVSPLPEKRGPGGKRPIGRPQPPDWTKGHRRPHCLSPKKDGSPSLCFNKNLGKLPTPPPRKKGKKKKKKNKTRKKKQKQQQQQSNNTASQTCQQGNFPPKTQKYRHPAPRKTGKPKSLCLFLLLFLNALFPKEPRGRGGVGASSQVFSRLWSFALSVMLRDGFLAAALGRRFAAGGGRAPRFARVVFLGGREPLENKGNWAASLNQI